ncbi:MAG: DUF4124 domain-containing protein [Methyloprofundus sp.]|nr:DUF4124 domain-containing protein [Methyloprofundus sp.]MBW6452537.1 DUF4124 domain-containing protein [Methyloprofundus sp.]
MKISRLLIFFLLIPPVHAEMYKCNEGGQISYQDKPCKTKGIEFTPNKDISAEQQQTAAEKLKSDLAKHNEQKRLAKEARDKERMIQAQEDRANAVYKKAQAIQEQAKQTGRQADALEKRNDYERDTRPYYIINRQPTPTPYLGK